MGLQGLGCRCSDTPEMRAEQLHEGEGAQHAPPSKTAFPLLLPPRGLSRAEESEFASGSPGH